MALDVFTKARRQIAVTGLVRIAGKFHSVGQRLNRPGEHYAGLVLKDDGTPAHHLVLMTARPDQRMPWRQAKDWVLSINGAQPTQHEAVLIRVHCLNHIEQGGYWVNESDRDPDYAWVYYFTTGGQYCIRKSSEAHAVAVRRIPIGGWDE